MRRIKQSRRKLLTTNIFGLIIHAIGTDKLLWSFCFTPEPCLKFDLNQNRVKYISNPINL